MDILNEFSAEPKFASFKTRMAAAFIDLIIYLGIGVILALLFGQVIQTDGGFEFNLSGLPALIFMAIWFLLFPVNEGVTGQTIGKRICKITVVKQNLNPVNIPLSLVRHLFYIIDFFLFLIGVILIAISKKKQRIGDLVAGTYVVAKDK